MQRGELHGGQDMHRTTCVITQACDSMLECQVVPRPWLATGCMTAEGMRRGVLRMLLRQALSPAKQSVSVMFTMPVRWFFVCACAGVSAGQHH